jgi:hypothetical protein
MCRFFPSNAAIQAHINGFVTAWTNRPTLSPYIQLTLLHNMLLPCRFFPSNAAIQARINGFVTAWTKGSDLVQFTPKGLAYSGPWGSLRHVGNAMFLMKAYAAKASLKALSPAAKREIDCAVRQQLGYMLGDSGRSFVVGYGVDPPQRPHHRCDENGCSQLFWSCCNVQLPTQQCCMQWVQQRGGCAIAAGCCDSVIPKLGNVPASGLCV